MAKTKKIKSKTVQKRNALRVTNVAMIGAKFVMPVVPATVMTIINWDEWFAQTNGGLPAGFITLLISTIIAVVGIMKRDDLAKKHISSIFPFALALIVAGAACLWLANVMHQAGMMFMYTGAAVFASAIDDQVQKSLVVPRLQEMNEDIVEGGLDKKTNKRDQRRQARLDEISEARRRATE